MNVCQFGSLFESSIVPKKTQKPIFLHKNHLLLYFEIKQSIINTKKVTQSFKFNVLIIKFSLRFSVFVQYFRSNVNAAYGRLISHNDQVTLLTQAIIELNATFLRFRRFLLAY